MKKSMIEKFFSGKSVSTLLSLLAIALFAIGFAASNEDDIFKPEIVIYGVSGDVTTLEIGQTLQLTTSAGSDVDWGSSDESVATISEDGLVTALKVGQTNITVYRKDRTITNGALIVIKVVNVGVDCVDDLIDQSEAE